MCDFFYKFVPSMSKNIDIKSFDYPLEEQNIAKYPLEQRSESKLLLYRDGEISHTKFGELPTLLGAESRLVFNNTKVIRARLIMHKPSGARVEIFCLEPHAPADYERSLASVGSCQWSCIVGNLKKWKEGAVQISYSFEGEEDTLEAYLVERGDGHHIIEFRWSAKITFGELLELLGRIPIPPYLNRESEQSDQTRYQTVYSKVEGSVAAPTAGLHFTPEVLEQLSAKGVEQEEVTLHVGAGTFLPVKCDNAAEHTMHTEHFEVRLSSLRKLQQRWGRVVAVGTTSVRTLESLAPLAYRIEQSGEPSAERAVGQWESYAIPREFSGERAIELLVSYMEQLGMESLKASTQIMITPVGYTFRIVNEIITNFHQPKSTLLLLISAYTGGGDNWRAIYDYALSHDFRFLSYGDSSYLRVTR